MPIVRHFCVCEKLDGVRWKVVEHVPETELKWKLSNTDSNDKDNV